MSFLVELPEDLYDRQAFAGFDPTLGFEANAKAMAWLCQLAYETRLPDKIRNVCGFWSLSPPQIIREPAKSTLPLSDTRGIIVEKAGATLIAFAGTDPLNLLNWVSDFYLGRPKADVHEGFLDAATSVWPIVSTALWQAKNQNRPIFVAGHSLGAAVALATLDMAARDPNARRSAQVYVFGCPRVGREDFKNRYDAVFGASTYRLVHGRDIVPTVPPSELEFRHVGRFISCASGGKFAAGSLNALPGSDEPLCDLGPFQGFRARLSGLFGPASIASRADVLGRLSQLLAPSIGDHLPDRYCAATTP